MLNRRGAQSDVVKVLDFGLVKAPTQSSRKPEAMAGTPLYMAPESIQSPESVDACSDIYAVGAVGYFLLTGRPVFEAETLAVLCQMHIAQPPIPPSQIVQNVADGLEQVLLACLEKSRSDRPQTAREVIRMLAACSDVDAWNTDIAERWWSRHGRESLGLSSMSESMGSQSASQTSKSIRSNIDSLGATMDHS
ncbi:MAG: protein kinase [Pirellulaceae bacterium]